MPQADRLDRGAPSLMDAEEVAKILGTSLDKGLSAVDASRRLAVEGTNELRSAPPTPAWRAFLAQFDDPLIFLLLAAVVVSVVAWALGGAGGWPIDAVVISLIIWLNAILGFCEQARAAQAVAALQKMTAVTSSVLRDGQVVRIPSAELVRGDLLVLAEGDAVGADGRLVQAAALQIQEASLTGESESVTKDVTTLPSQVPIGDRLNMVFKGTAVTRGTGRALVTATAMGTEMGAIAEMLEAAREEPTPLQREIASIGRMLGIAVVLITLVVMVTIFLLSEIRTAADVVAVALLGVSLAVAAVPEGLPAVLSVVLALGVQRMAKHHAIVKKLSSVETLGAASIVCTDKTGTLTRSEMTIERVVTASGRSHLTGAGYIPVGRVEFEGGAGSAEAHAEHIVVLSGGSLASNADLRLRGDVWEIQGDPTEAAFLVAEHKMGVHERRMRRFKRLGEVPFTSDRKLMSTIEEDLEHAGELVLVTKGAPDVLLDRCTLVREGMAAVPLDESRRQRILADVTELTDSALRTLAVAYRPLGVKEAPAADESLERELIFVGLVGIIDPPREEAAIAIAQAHRAGIRVLMITGDHPRTAERIGSDLGIVDPGSAEALTGPQLDEMDDASLAAAVRMTAIYARVAPAHKLRIVDALQADGNIVAMTGDGVNDAPALKSADIGIAMGITGTEVTREAADMILSDDNFATIIEAVREGRAIFDNIKKFLRYLLSSNMGEVLTVFFGVVLSGFLGLTGAGDTVVLPLLATQILWINLITDSGPALAMGVDPEIDDVMARRPRSIDDKILDGRMWSGVLLTGLVMAGVTLLTIDIYLPGGLVAGGSDLAHARTAGFTVLVLAQLFNCFNCRSETTSAFRHLFVNPWLWAAIALSALLQVAVVHVGFLNHAFGTVPLEPVQWLVCLAMASVVLWFAELRKWVERWSDR